MSALLVSLFTFVQFNCENLFDCQHDSLKNDVEFLPDGVVPLDSLPLLAQAEPRGADHRVVR